MTTIAPTEVDSQSLSDERGDQDPNASDVFRAMQKLASRVVSRVSLVDVNMPSLNAQLVKVPPATMKTDTSVGGNWTLEGDRLATQLRYEVKAMDPDNDDVVWAVTVVVALHYDVSPGEVISEHEYEAFLFTSAQVAAHAYARVVIQDLTGRIGVPPFALEVFRVPASTDS